MIKWNLSMFWNTAPPKDCTMLKDYSTLTQCYHVFGTEKKKNEGLHCINFLK